LMDHWPWQDPSQPQTVPCLRADLPHLSTGPTSHDPLETHMPATRSLQPAVRTQPDLVVLSHLRWPWVWQRPQHVVSRLARRRSQDGARTWFVEEPVTGDVQQPELRQEQIDGLTRVWLEIPAGNGRHQHPGFDHPLAGDYGDLLAQAIGAGGSSVPPDVWLYTPMALDVAQCLEPGRLVYDVMDDLASFKDAPEGLVLRQRRLLGEADVVFTGGPSLDRSVRRQRQDGVHLFRSGVETAHYRRSRALRRPQERPVAGYVGVVDERLDLQLLQDLAEWLPEWTVRIVGPVAKIDEAALPRTANVEYLGLTPYEELPAVMAGLDVALMPFALNEATRSISPTKTLEYLAAGLPVVSTRVPDVVSDYTDVVHLADDGEGFAAACREVIQHDARARDRRTRPLQVRQEWDFIASSMAALLDQVTGAGLRRDEEPA
jgi:glycosyltransferase involved in cell wall biosynthesis